MSFFRTLFNSRLRLAGIATAGYADCCQTTKGVKSNFQAMALTLAISGLAMFGGEAAAKSKVTGGSYDHCVDYFFDGSSYGWLAFANKCTDPIYVVFEGNHSGAMTIKPGRKSNTGWTRAEMGGINFAVCPGGMVPKDASGNFWEGGKYYCEGD